MQTIVALSTPIGRSGIGVIRLSGDASLKIARDLVADPTFAPEPRTAHLRDARDPSSNEVFDQVLITYFKTPHSFTGEDVVEISCHGSPILLRKVIDICLALGARMAEAGEFSLRALANGRMNLTQAEAIRDLINAQTTAAARQAVKQLRGEFSNQLQPLKDKLLDVIVLLESALEFVEDDLPATQVDKVRSNLIDISREVDRIAATFAAGHLIRDGLRVAIVGRPNVGKSSLFNALVGSDRAIVTDIAGTTRDQIHERLTIRDIPISLIDTAGLRETEDHVESIGVERSRRAIADADMVVAIFDASDSLTREDVEILESVTGLRHLIAVNKIDKLEAGKPDSFVAELQRKFPEATTTVVEISAKTTEGLDQLRDAIVKPFLHDEIDSAGFLVSDARHHDLLVRTGEEIRSSLQLLEKSASEELVLVGLHNALRYLGEITGETTAEDVLTRIFSTFCIGK